MVKCIKMWKIHYKKHGYKHLVFLKFCQMIFNHPPFTFPLYYRYSLILSDLFLGFILLLLLLNCNVQVGKYYLFIYLFVYFFVLFQENHSQYLRNSNFCLMGMCASEWVLKHPKAYCTNVSITIQNIFVDFHF